MRARTLCVVITYDDPGSRERTNRGPGPAVLGPLHVRGGRCQRCEGSSRPNQELRDHRGAVRSAAV